MKHLFTLFFCTFGALCQASNEIETKSPSSPTKYTGNFSNHAMNRYMPYSKKQQPAKQKTKEEYPWFIIPKTDPLKQKPLWYLSPFWKNPFCCKTFSTIVNMLFKNRKPNKNLYDGFEVEMNPRLYAMTITPKRKNTSHTQNKVLQSLYSFFEVCRIISDFLPREYSPNNLAIFSMCEEETWHIKAFLQSDETEAILKRKKDLTVDEIFQKTSLSKDKEFVDAVYDNEVYKELERSFKSMKKYNPYMLQTICYFDEETPYILIKKIPLVQIKNKTFCNNFEMITLFHTTGLLANELLPKLEEASKKKVSPFSEYQFKYEKISDEPFEVKISIITDPLKLTNNLNNISMEFAQSAKNLNLPLEFSEEEKK